MRSTHPISLETATWQDVCRNGISESALGQFMDRHFEQYRTGQWYARQDVQKGKAILTREQVQAQLGLDPRRKTAVVFSQVLWDATFFYGQGLFEDYATWLVETTKAACRNSNLNWVIKLHPANAWKLARDGYKGELVEHRLFRQHIGPLPDHVKVLDPAAPINTASLFTCIDYGLTVRGTVGMELPMFGIPVITGGTGRYAGLGFTVDPATREQYFDTLAHAEEIPPLTDQQIRLARTYAYAIFDLRPLVMHSMRVDYHPSVRSINELVPIVTPLVDTPESLEASSDLRAFGAWAAKTDSPDLLGGIANPAL
jgi:hypothetical protein